MVYIYNALFLKFMKLISKGIFMFVNVYERRLLYGEDSHVIQVQHYSPLGCATTKCVWTINMLPPSSGLT
jgi:hypothetical protein